MKFWYRDKIISSWEKNGKQLPAPHQLKQIIIESYQKKYKYNILVETGTYLGHMVEAERRNFKTIYSIELDDNLWKNAVEKFRKYSHINILYGDSGKMLNKVTLQLNEPGIFWLDGHYSGEGTAKGDKECPIYGEIDAIFKEKKFDHILLIDDARLFVGKADYPTIPELTKYVQAKDPRYNALVETDVIRYTVA